MATPYAEELDRREADYLDAAGFEVLAIDGLGLEANTDIGARWPENAYRQASARLDAVDADPDALFVSCTNYRTLPVVERLEADRGVPVVTSNGATLWDALRRAGVSTASVPGRLGEAR